MTYREDAAAKARERLGDEAITLDELERRHIERVLAATDGHISGAAIVLGIRRQSLQRRLHRLRRIA